MERGGYSNRGRGGNGNNNRGRGGRGGRGGNGYVNGNGDRGGRGGGGRFYPPNQSPVVNHGGRGSGPPPNQRSVVHRDGRGYGPTPDQSPVVNHGGYGRGSGPPPNQSAVVNRGGGGIGSGPPPNPPTRVNNHSHPIPRTNIERQSISDSDKTFEKLSPVHRPDRGGTIAIRTTRLRVNHFAVTFNPQTIVNHYNVDVKPKLPPKQGRPPPKISKSHLSMIRDKLFAGHPETMPLKMTGYDGEKTIVSAVPLPEETFTVDISHGEDDKPLSYVVTLTLVNKLEFRKLRDYLSGNVLSIPRDVLQGMDLVVRENPTRCTVPVGRCFYPTNPPSGDNDLGHGIIAIRGFQQSLKTTSQGLAMCLDHSVLSFRKKLSVLDFLAAHIDGFNVAEFWKYKEKVQEALIGVKVNVTHRRTKQKYTIVKLTDRETRHITFPLVDPEGKIPPTDVSLVAYFKDKHGVDIKHKDIHALDFGGNKMNYVPMEFCVLVEGQRFPKEYLDKNASKTLKDMSLARPWDREALIQKMVKSSDGPCGGGILQNFGMNVNTTMTNVTGRVIGPPTLKLGDPTGRIISMTLDPEKCQWNLLGRSMVEVKSVECWGILDFTCQGSNRYNKFNAHQFVPRLIEKYRKFGVNMEEPAWYEPSTMRKLGDYGSLCLLLENINYQVYKRCQRRLQFLLCVMAHKDPGYKWLKWISETKVGIVTQCCLSISANEVKDQYLTNLALKINAKLGGSNVELNNNLPHFDDESHVMFIGADVNHPASRDIESPSVSAVVATVNWPAANRYAARVCFQEHRKEKIVNFGKICLELVACYERLNKVRPEKIVIFRDGVSESQFLMVLTEELLDLKSVFKDSNYFPTITLIVAQKRHQTRLFPAGRNEGTHGGNVFPGTVVDTKIIHPFEFDFYLCSHYGSLGTSKPTHYHVLWDEHQFTSDGLQQLIYNMCFTFARCTKPVSLVPPVYYADLAAYRGRLYHEAMIGVQSPGSAASSSSSHMASSSSLTSSTSISNDPIFYKLHADVENGMFFI